MRKWIIAGSRDSYFDGEDYKWLKRWLHRELVTNGMPVIITGGQRGVDYCARLWAENSGLENIEVKAQWKRFGKAAGPIRNREMARMADGLIAFPGWRGTNDMIEAAWEYDLEIVFRKANPETQGEQG